MASKVDEKLSKVFIKPRCPPCKKPSLVFRTVKFANKILFAGSLLFYCQHHGAWGSPEESLEFVSKISDHIRILIPYHIRTLIEKDE